ncbi:MAG: UxaA family hydrolase [Anaerolineae bacterium]|nr:UxaA family hydrolase [Anaerolineae bacterium]
MSFKAYVRSDGSVGVRNHLGIVSTVACANDVARWIADQVPGAVAFTHQQGCGNPGPDMAMVYRTLIGLGRNPNLGAVLLVSLGCEGPCEHLREGIARSGKRVESVVIQQLGGASKAFDEGCRIAREMVSELSLLEREEVDESRLIVGVKCGASDTTQGIAANPAVGAMCDLVIKAGGTCVFGETPEMLGTEHILARRAASAEIGEKIRAMVEDVEKRAAILGVDIRGANPSRGNIAGGLTTIEEKSLGAIVKGGTSTIRGVLEQGEYPQGKGLYLLNSPGQEPKAVTALAASGAQIIMFATGIGAPQGFPFVPVIKVTANPRTAEHLTEHIDCFVDIFGDAKVEDLGAQIHQEMLAVASGHLTKAETLNYGAYPDIWTTGSVF